MWVTRRGVRQFTGLTSLSTQAWGASSFICRGGRHAEALHRQERCAQSEFHLQRNQCDGAPAPKVDVRRGARRHKPKSKAASAQYIHQAEMTFRGKKGQGLEWRMGRGGDGLMRERMG